MTTRSGPTIEDIRAFRDSISERIVRTPVMRCAAIEDLLANGTKVYAKLEFLQRTGTFKARGALANLLSLTPEQLQRGVTAVSAGNHAIANERIRTETTWGLNIAGTITSYAEKNNFAAIAAGLHGVNEGFMKRMSLAGGTTSSLIERADKVALWCCP